MNVVLLVIYSAFINSILFEFKGQAMVRWFAQWTKMFKWSSELSLEDTDQLLFSYPRSIILSGSVSLVCTHLKAITELHMPSNWQILSKINHTCVFWQKKLFVHRNIYNTSSAVKISILNCWASRLKKKKWRLIYFKTITTTLHSK